MQLTGSDYGDYGFRPIEDLVHVLVPLFTALVGMQWLINKSNSSINT